jgi:hypothetical protein
MIFICWVVSFENAVFTFIRAYGGGCQPPFLLFYPTSLH